MKKILLFLILLTLSTILNAQTTQYSDGFENLSLGNLRNYDCWKASSTHVQVRNGTAYEGTQYAEAKDGEYIIGQEYLFESGKSYTISFYCKSTTSSNITISVTNNITGNYSTIPIINIVNGVNWVNYTTVFIPSVSGIANFKLDFSSNGNSYDTMIDDIVTTIPTSSVLSTTVSCNSPLPLTFLSFTGTLIQDSNEVNLIWITTDEKYLSHFILETSLDAKDWNEIGVIEAINTTSINEYRFNTKIYNNSYYILSAVDVDGTIKKYSAIYISYDTLSCYFDQASKKLYITNIKSIEVIDINSRTFYKNTNLFNISEIDLSIIPRGMYILIIGDEINKKTVKLNIL